MIKKLLIFLAICSPVLADQIAINSCSYLNNNDNSLIISQTEAQDLLNVDCSAGGKSIRKRDGYGTYKTLGTGQAIHGVHHFYDSSGSDVMVIGSSTSLYGTVSDATATQLVSSATLNSTWDCTDTQGSAYCVTSSRDFYLRTTGAAIEWKTSPLGTMVMSTPDRNIVAGVSGSANTLFWSGSGAFTTFTTGINAADPFTEVIGSPGSKITHIRWGCNKVLWWKDQSFGYINGDNQTNLELKIVSDSIGTFDNTSSVDPGGDVWFRGQDGHVYRYDCSGLEKMTIDISSNIASSGRRTSNFLNVTTQADFQIGASSPSNPSSSLNMTISAGDVQPGSFTVTENSSASGWGSGTASSVSVGASSITLTLNNSGNVTNNSFDTAGGTAQDVQSWTRTVVGGPIVQRATTLSWGSTCLSAPTTPKSGTGALSANMTSTSGQSRTIQLLLASDNSVLTSVSVPTAKACTDWSNSVTLTAGSHVGKRVRLKFAITDSNATNTLTQDTSFILGGDITIYYIKEVDGSSGSGSAYFDDITNGSSTVTTGNFTSQAINTKLPYSYVLPTIAWTVNSTTPSFVLQRSADGSTGWVEVSQGTGTNSSIGTPYIRYISTFTIGSNDNALTSLTSVNFIARSSGTYFSQVKNDASISSWDTFTANYTNSGASSHQFFIRSASYPFYVLGSSPAWTAATVGAVPTLATAQYFQVIDSFTITAATETPTLNDFTLNWFDGSASDQSYSTYFDNSIWFTVASGAGASTNNYIFKCDLIHLAISPSDSCWTLYNFGAGGFTIQSNKLYFGSTSASTVFKFGDGVTSDNGTSIQSFWKSKDFSGADPWVTNNLTQIDSYWTKNQNQTATVTYSLDTSTSTTSYTVALSSGTQSLIRNAKGAPTGKNFNLINFQVGDTSASSSWEFLGLRAMFTSVGYRPTQ